MKRGTYMSTEKIVITTNLRLDIIERRKEKGISSYDLSEQVGNGHSKFWLQNIESGKTKKIKKDDLLSIYMILEGSNDPNEVLPIIEQLLNQSLGDSVRPWYELIIPDSDYSELYEEEDLMDALDVLLEEYFVPQISDRIFAMPVNQKQAALTALRHFYYSVYRNPDLAFALIGIPIYGVNEKDQKEHINSMNDILSLYSKYNNMSIKNNSMQAIKEQQEFQKEMQEVFAEWIHEAFSNFEEIIPELSKAIKSGDHDLCALSRKFVQNVTFKIEQGQPNVTKHYLKSFQIFTGKDFAVHIRECVNWFVGFHEQYKLPLVYSIFSPETLNSIYEYLNNYGKIKFRRRFPSTE